MSGKKERVIKYDNCNKNKIGIFLKLSWSSHIVVLKHSLF